MTLELSYDSFSDAGLASGDPDGRPARPNRHVWIGGRDVIYLEEVPAGRDNGCRFVLDARPELTAGKGLKFVDRDGRVLAEVGTGGFSVDAAALDGGRLVFVRSGPFGGRADCYHVDTTPLRERVVDTGRGGKRPVGELRFYWARDSR